MFTDKDFLNYFNELEVVEKTMRDVYKHALNKIKDPSVKKFFSTLYIQETEHQNFVSEIKEIVIKRFFEDEI